MQITDITEPKPCANCKAKRARWDSIYCSENCKSQFLEFEDDDCAPKPTVSFQLVNALGDVNTYIADCLREIETALDEEIREDSNSPDWQYYKGQQDALRDMRKYISRKIASEAR